MTILKSHVRSIDGLPFFSVGDYGAVGDGTTDDTAAIQAAIDAAEAAGGGEVKLLGNTYLISSTLNINESNVSLRGEGDTWVQQGHPNIRAQAATRILWDATASASTMVKFETLAGEQNKVRGGISNLMIDGNEVATVGLNIHTWRGAVFDRVTCFACTQDQFLLSVTNSVLSSGPADVQACEFYNCFASTFGGSGWFLTNTANGFRLTGGTANNSGNTSFNQFYTCKAQMSMGVGFVLENTDNNYFFGCAGAASYDSSQYGMILESSENDTGTRDSSARYNTVIAGEMKILCRAATATTGSGAFSSAFSNTFVGNTRSNSKPRVETGQASNYARSNGTNFKECTAIVLDSDEYFSSGSPINLKSAQIDEEYKIHLDPTSTPGNHYLTFENTANATGNTPRVRYKDMDFQLEIDSTASTIEPAMILRKNNSSGTAVGLAKIQWRGTNSALTDDVDAGRIDSTWVDTTAGSETARMAIHPQYNGNSETIPAMQWQNGVMVPDNVTSIFPRGFGTVNIADSCWIADTKRVDDTGFYDQNGVKILVEQQSVINTNTDNTGGTSSATLVTMDATFRAAYGTSASRIDDNFASVTHKLNLVVNALRAHGLVASS